MGEPSDSRELVPALAALPGHLFWRAAARVSLLVADVLPTGVDIHEYAALLALPGGTTRSQQALAEAIGVSRTTMVKVAADLSGAGYVERVRNPDDRRSYALTRTREGASVARRWKRHVDALEASATAHFSAADRDDLHGLLLRVAEDDLAPDVPEPLRQSTAFLVSRIHARMHREFVAALAPFDLMPPHYGALTALQALGPVSQVRLARSLGVSGAHMVQLVDELEHRGLVVRRRDESDRRTQLLHLCDGVEDVVAPATEAGREATARVLGALSPREVDRLVELLQRFIRT
ncbi:MAG: MarR family transcriptional regulator [Nocardioidaceae bacterium]|nr:MarR family transcriptional regulator [Nocardioidaceae bacterium]